LAARPLPQARAYAQSKLANVLFTYDLARRLEGSGVSTNCLHPGPVRTKITSGLSGLGAWIARLERPFARTPERGAETVAYLASSPDVEGINGKYFVDRRE
jgi:retinol dehydrogenase 14